jgi:hypothetical protein
MCVVETVAFRVILRSNGAGQMLLPPGFGVIPRLVLLV